MKHIRYCLYTASVVGETAHAQKVMQRFKIKYSHSTPQSISDQWWFWNCENLPEHLPDYLTELKLNPMDCIGHGLSKEEAVSILGVEKRKV